jgi:hypothetical protein
VAPAPTTAGIRGHSTRALRLANGHQRTGSCGRRLTGSLPSAIATDVAPRHDACRSADKPGCSPARVDPLPLKVLTVRCVQDQPLTLEDVAST